MSSSIKHKPTSYLESRNLMKKDGGMRWWGDREMGE